MNACAKYLDNPSNSCCNISAWRDVVDRTTDQLPYQQIAIHHATSVTKHCQHSLAPQSPNVRNCCFCWFI